MKTSRKKHAMANIFQTHSGRFHVRLEEGGGPGWSFHLGATKTPTSGSHRAMPHRWLAENSRASNPATAPWQMESWCGRRLTPNKSCSLVCQRVNKLHLISLKCGENYKPFTLEPVPQKHVQLPQRSALSWQRVFRRKPGSPDPIHDVVP